MTDRDDRHSEVEDGFGELEEVRHDLGRGVNYGVVGGRLVQGLDVAKIRVEVNIDSLDR